MKFRMSRRIFSALALTSFLVPAYASPGVERIEITASCFARPAGQVVIHETSCKDQTYRLRVTPKEKRVEFESSRARSPLDISHTRFAAALLKRSHWGEVHMSCPEGGIHATFHGFRLVKGKAPVPVVFGVSILDQEIRNDDGLDRNAAEHIRILTDRMDD